jgi:hypothetical protein
VSEQSGQERNGDGVPPGAMPRDDEPGGESTPLDTSGDGPVRLEDRTSTDEKGAPGSNQAKAEPMPPTQAHRDPSAPLTPPPLEEMNVGVDDPQRPSLGGGRTGTGTGTGTGGAVAVPAGPSAEGLAPAAGRPTVDSTTATGTDRGPENPLSVTPGESHRAPGLQGTPSPAERVETDLAASAAAMTAGPHQERGAGDVHGVPVPSEQPAPGTGAEQSPVQGARLPQAE